METAISSLTIVSINRCSSSRVIKVFVPSPQPLDPVLSSQLAPSPRRSYRQPLLSLFERPNLGQAPDIPSLAHRRRHERDNDRPRLVGGHQRRPKCEDVGA